MSDRRGAPIWWVSILTPRIETEKFIMSLLKKSWSLCSGSFSLPFIAHVLLTKSVNPLQCNSYTLNGIQEVSGSIPLISTTV